MREVDWILFTKNELIWVKSALKDAIRYCEVLCEEGLSRDGRKEVNKCIKEYKILGKKLDSVTK